MNTIHNTIWVTAKTLLKVSATILLLAGPAFAQTLVQIASLNSLPESIQDDINQLCLPSQYRDGATAYRKCVAKQIELRNSDSAILMDNYSFDEKYAIQQSCGSEVSSNESYLICIRKETNKLDAVPVPELSALNEDEQNAIQLSCYDAQKYEGAASYRQCINTAQDELLSIPRTNLSQLSSIEQNEIKLECTNASRQKRSSNYRLCIAESLADILIVQRNGRAITSPSSSIVESSTSAAEPAPIEEVTIVTVAKPNNDVTDLQSLVLDQNPDKDTVQAPTVQVTSLTTTPDTENSRPVKTLTVTELTNTEPGIVAIAEPQPAPESAPESALETALETETEPETTTSAELETEQIPDEVLSPFAAFKENPLEFLKNIDLAKYSDYFKILLPVVIMLVVLKLLAMLLRRRKKTLPPMKQQYQPIDFPDEEFEDLHTEPGFAPANKQAVQPVDLSDPFSEGPSVTGRQTERPDPNSDPNFDFLDNHEHPASPNADMYAEPDSTSSAALLDQTLHTPIYNETEFGHWLHQQPVENHKRLCTEFMLYWVSYGDGNYSPEQKEELLRAVELNEHDLIKKWVLEQNPSTLVDMLQRVWSIFSKAEVEQTISMMFAVLVKTEISPVQNTFFRFLADFAHIGSEGLNQLHMDSFGTGLPPLPRPDDERWWQRQLIAESQALANVEPLEQSDYEICLSLLGLNDPAGPEEIKNAYAQIANRCAPEKFDRLGIKERDLVQRHLGKYTQAYEYLLELNQ